MELTITITLAALGLLLWAMLAVKNSEVLEIASASGNDWVSLDTIARGIQNRKPGLRGRFLWPYFLWASNKALTRLTKDGRISAATVAPAEEDDIRLSLAIVRLGNKGYPPFKYRVTNPSQSRPPVAEAECGA